MFHRILYVLVLSIFCWSCAQLGSPTGGPIDEDPPGVVSSDPPNYSVRFKAKKISITFDEYIVLDNVTQELIVSPPMEEKPDVKLRKRTIIVQFEEELKDSTTYTFNFGSAIKDLHEGNILLNYEYVFSTGDVLDSMSVRGTIRYAEDLSMAEEPISILLYDDLRDSVPLTEIPLYVGKSDDSGVFSVNNLRPDVYKVFALKDGNGNLLFDLPGEEIAFLDTSLIVNAEFSRMLFEAADTLEADTLAVDTFVVDTLDMEGDSAEMAVDTLIESGPNLNAIYIDLLLFAERPEIQYITDFSRDDRRKLQVIFALPVTDSFRYRPLLSPADQMEILEYFSPDRDSLTLWVLDSTEYRRDTLAFQMQYTVKDSLEQFVTKTDSLWFTFRERTESRRRGNDQEVEESVEKLAITTIRSGRELDLNRNLRLESDFPIREIRDSLIRLYHIPDTVEVAEPFEVVPDSLLLNRWWIRADWESASQYRLFIPPGTIVSHYPLEHDTIDVSFKTRDQEYYGQILLNLENVNNRVLVQITSEDKVIRELAVSESGQYAFPYLVPGEYGVTCIHDMNGNGRWDTGKYMKKLQPEAVEKLPSQITVRSNWDHNVNMVLKK